MSRQFKGWLGITLGLLLARSACTVVPGLDAGFWAIAGPLGLLCAGLAWQLWGVWNMICHLCGWGERTK